MIYLQLWDFAHTYIKYIASYLVENLIFVKNYIHEVLQFQRRFNIFKTKYTCITGSSILMYTYDGRLKTSVSIDKAFIENYGDVQAIADNILKYLDVLEKEISKYGDFSHLLLA